MKLLGNILTTCFISFLFLFIPFSTVPYAGVDSFSATLIDFDGNVLILKGETDEWLDVENNMPIQRDDHIFPGEASYAEIFVDDGSTIKVEESSEINLRELTFDEDTEEVEIEIFLKAGILLSNIVAAIQRSPSVRVYTNTAVAGVRGTEFVVDATDPDKTSIGVFSGQVEASGLDEDGNAVEYESVSLEQGYQTTVVRNDAPVRPFVHKRRMLLQKRRMVALRQRAIERRKRIPEIRRKRRMIRRRVIMHRKKQLQNHRPNSNQTAPHSHKTGPGPRPPKRRPVRRPPPR